MPVLISATESEIEQHSRGLIEHVGLMEKELITLDFWHATLSKYVVFSNMNSLQY